GGAGAIGSNGVAAGGGAIGTIAEGESIREIEIFGGGLIDAGEQVAQKDAIRGEGRVFVVGRGVLGTDGEVGDESRARDSTNVDKGGVDPEIEGLGITGT
ncbi:uncharacterized protein NPIL_205831, partial [Nephila pilipes]